MKLIKPSVVLVAALFTNACETNRRGDYVLSRQGVNGALIGAAVGVGVTAIAYGIANSSNNSAPYSRPAPRREYINCDSITVGSTTDYYGRPYSVVMANGRVMSQPTSNAYAWQQANAMRRDCFNGYLVGEHQDENGDQVAYVSELAPKL